jgi:hypothetical protein
MRQTIVFVLGVVALMAGVLCEPAHAQAGKIAKDGVNKAFQTAGFDSPFGRHPEVPPIQIDGKYVYILDLIPGRVTNNFHAKWDGVRTFHVHSDGLSLGTRMKAAFQRKGDKQHWEDSNRGPQFKIGDTIAVDGRYNYLADRNFTWGDRQESEYPDAMIILAEEGLTMERICEYFGG